jgi:hypothetical protein
MDSKVIVARFFRTSSGKEPVREWLKNQTDENKKSIGGDIAAIAWSNKKINENSKRRFGISQKTQKYCVAGRSGK